MPRAVSGTSGSERADNGAVVAAPAATAGEGAGATPGLAGASPAAACLHQCKCRPAKCSCVRLTEAGNKQAPQSSTKSFGRAHHSSWNAASVWVSPSSRSSPSSVRRTTCAHQACVRNKLSTPPRCTTLPTAQVSTPWHPKRGKPCCHSPTLHSLGAPAPAWQRPLLTLGTAPPELAPPPLPAPHQGCELPR